MLLLLINDLPACTNLKQEFFTCWQRVKIERFFINKLIVKVLFSCLKLAQRQITLPIGQCRQAHIEPGDEYNSPVNLRVTRVNIFQAFCILHEKAMTLAIPVQFHGEPLLLAGRYAR